MVDQEHRVDPPPSLTLGQLLGASLRIWSEHLTAIATVAAVVVFPMSIWEGALPPVRLPVLNSPSSLTPAVMAHLAQQMRPWVPALLVNVAASYIMIAAATHLVAEYGEGRVAGPWEAYRQALLHLPSLCTTGLSEALLLLLLLGAVSAVGAALGPGAWLVLAVVAALLLGIYLGLALQVAMRENRGDVRALWRSASLVHGAFWPILGALVAAAVLTALLSTISTIPLSAGVNGFTRALSELLSDLVTVTAGMLPVTVLTVAYTARTGRLHSRFLPAGPFSL